MKYERFEDLPVWQASTDLAAKMYPWTSQPVFRGKGDLANQMQRAALSISNNIAEGFERGTTNELIAFLYYARGSAGEVRSMLCVMERVTDFDHLNSQISDFICQCESISRQIRGWTNSLQNSDIEGQRHLNDRTRQRYDQDLRRGAFFAKQREFAKRQEAALNDFAARRQEESDEETAE